MFNQTREFIEYATKFIEGKTLDLGAGNAKYRDIIRQKADEYIAMDKFPGANITLVGDVSNIPLPDESINTIIQTQVLEHVKNPWKVVAEMKRVLSKKGICIVTAPFMHPYHEDPIDYFRFSKEGLKSLFIEENFEIIDYGNYGNMYIVIYTIIKYLFFHPYKKQRKGYWRINRILTKTAIFLNRFSNNNIIYDSSYVIAKKR